MIIAICSNQYTTPAVHEPTSTDLGLDDVEGPLSDEINNSGPQPSPSVGVGRPEANLHSKRVDINSESNLFY